MRRMLWLVTLTALVGCAQTPFTAEGIAKALEAAVPALGNLDKSKEGANSQGEGVNVNLFVKDVPGAWWPLSRFFIGTKHEVTYFIVVQGKEMKDGGDHRLREGMAAELAEDGRRQEHRQRTLRRHQGRALRLRGKYDALRRHNARVQAVRRKACRNRHRRPSLR